MKLRREGREWACRCPLHEDHTPSFKVNAEKQLFHCHGCDAGGSVIELHAALEGIPIEDAKRELGGNQQQRPSKFRLDKNGKRIWKGGMGDTRRVPYRLLELLLSDEVIVVEGEKDADVLVEKADRVATCNPGGAGKWRAEYARYLKDKRVYIIPDQDEAGRKHADDVARSLVDVARSIMLVTLPKGIKDTAELAQANGQVFSEKLTELLKEARALSSCLRPRATTRKKIPQVTKTTRASTRRRRRSRIGGN